MAVVGSVSVGGAIVGSAHHRGEQRPAVREQSFVEARVPHRRVDERRPSLRLALGVGAYLGGDLPPDPEHRAVERGGKLLGREAREDLPGAARW